MKTFKLTLLVMVTALICTTSARADILTFALNYEFSGGTAPASATLPWITATFTSVDANHVLLTMDNENLTGSEFVSKWYFNLDPSLAIGSLSAAFVSGQGLETGATSPYFRTNAFKADGDGKYDILFDFPPPPGNGSSKFTAGESSVWLFTYDGVGTFNANSFNFLSAPAGEHGPFHSAAHVQGIGPTGALSGWIADVPEPHTYALTALLGFLGVALWRRRRPA